MNLKEVLQNTFEAGFKAGVNRQHSMSMSLHSSMMPEKTSLEQMFELIWSESKDDLPHIQSECDCEKNTGGTVRKVLKCNECGKDVKGIKFETT